MQIHSSPVLVLLTQVGIILLASRVVGWLFARLRQPQVMGEMIAGILLGPSLFGLLAPETHAVIFPPESIPSLGVLSQIGVILFLFLVGLDLDPRLLRNRGHAAVVISHVSIVAPFLLGAALTLYLYPRVFNDAPSMDFASVALFMGAAMSITAFPVLARILTERSLHKTNVGAVTITCAAVDDVTAWCMLAFVVGIARAEGFRPAITTAALSAVYVGVMFLIVRPFIHRLLAAYERRGIINQGIIALILLLTLISAWCTEAIGIHALFGAFLMGAIMPKDTDLVRALVEKLEDFTVVFLLPMFFVYTGLNTQIGLLASPALINMTLLIIAVACIGKFGGSALAAWTCGMSWRESSALGILMNTRGLMEMVILNIGRELGVITPAVFAMMVLMALVTTFMTTPVLQLVYPRRLYAGVPTAKPPRKQAFSVLIPVADPRSGGSLLQLADAITGRAETARAIFALHLSRPSESEGYRLPTNEMDPALRLLLDHAARHKIPVEPITFTSRDVAADVSRVARERQADLVLIGFHKSVFGKTILGGTVHRVLTGVDTDVAVFVDRGFLGARRILAPYLGGSHDQLALRLAHRLARNVDAEVTVLHVTQPDDGSRSSVDAKAATERVFDDPSQPLPVDFKVVEDPSPVDAVLREARGYDLVVIGVSEEWGLESHLFGWRPERIAEGCPTSMLIVRRYADDRAAVEAAPSVPATEAAGAGATSSA